MASNKNDSANVPEKSNNNKVLYGGLASVALLFLVLCWYMFGNTSNKKELRREEVIAEVNKLIEYGFYSPKICRAYDDYKKASANDKDRYKQKLKSLLSQTNANDIAKAYKEVEQGVENCKSQMISMISDKKIDEVKTRLVAFSKGYKSQKIVYKNKEVKHNKDIVKEIIQKVLNELGSAKDAKTAAERKNWLKEAKERLEGCTEISYRWGIGSNPFEEINALIEEEDDDAYNEVNNIIGDISAISKIIPDAGSMGKKYNPESLKEALKTWKEKYQTIIDDMGAAIALELIDSGDEEEHK